MSTALSAAGPQGARATGRLARLQWYARRLARMSPGEIIGRGRDAAVKLLWRRHRRGFAVPAPLAGAGWAGGAVPGPGDLVRDRASDTRLIDTAERLLQGRLAILGVTSDRFGAEPDWFGDPLTGRRAPDRDFAFAIPYRDAARVGDIKYVWEPSRHQYLVQLAAAHWLTGDPRHAERVALHLRHWWQANPFLSGVHWISGIEVGIRLISWVWIRRLLDGWEGAADLFEGDPVFRSQLYHHQVFLARLPSHGSSANNHLVAELAGAFAAATAFPLFAESAGWAAQARRALEHQIEAQTYPDGLNRELASDYHGLTLELFLAAAVEASAAGRPLSQAAHERLRAMLDALASGVDVELRFGRQGDTDGAFGLIVDGDGFDRWASLLATGQALFGAASWWPALQAADLRAAMLAAVAGPLDAGPKPRAPARLRLFAEAGQALLGDLERRPDEIWCRCDHGPHGFLRTAAHAHADALSIELRHGGVDVLSDPGTHCYYSEPDFRNYFRSTAGHNALEVDGIGQAEPAGTFLWTNQPRSTLLDLDGLDAGERAVWRARHDGYARLTPPALHERTVTLDRTARSLQVADVLDGGPERAVRLFWHLGPAVDCRLEGAEARLAWTGPAGRFEAVLRLPPTLDWRAARGETAPVAGWYSARFGEREPAVTLIGSGRLASGAVLRTELSIRPAAGSVDPAAGVRPESTSG